MSEMAQFQPRTPGTVSEPTPADLVIRMAEPGDGAGIARISAAREGLALEDLQPLIEAQLARPECGDQIAVWIASSAGETVGYGRVIWDNRAEGTGPRAVPTGWYLMGAVVRPGWRRRGIGRALLLTRLAWLAKRTDCAYTVTSEHNRVSQALLKSVGFIAIRRDVTHPGITFNKGVGLLLSAPVRAAD